MPEKMTASYVLTCSSCKKEYDETRCHNLCARCGSALEAVFDYKRLKERLNVFDLRFA